MAVAHVPLWPQIKPAPPHPWLCFADALLGAVHEGADGHTRLPLTVTLGKELWGKQA